LILRPWEDRDRIPLAAVLGDPQVRRFYVHPLSPTETSAEIDRALALTSVNGFHFGAAELRTTGELVGLIGIGVIPDAVRAVLNGRPRVEIGWEFRRQFWGQGLAPEGARAWLGYAFDGLRLSEIVAFTAKLNLPSQRVMQKIGMSRDPAGDFDHPRVPEGHVLRPHVLYRITRSSPQ
jgi:RimJ/RimL family protein N-acetyltransferase